jgi:hypothetical protein
VSSKGRGKKLWIQKEEGKKGKRIIRVDQINRRVKRKCKNRDKGRSKGEDKEERQKEWENGKQGTPEKGRAVEGTKERKAQRVAIRMCKGGARKGAQKRSKREENEGKEKRKRGEERKGKEGTSGYRARGETKRRGKRSSIR